MSDPRALRHADERRARALERLRIDRLVDRALVPAAERVAREETERLAREAEAKARRERERLDREAREAEEKAARARNAENKAKAEAAAAVTAAAKGVAAKAEAGKVESAEAARAFDAMLQGARTSGEALVLLALRRTDGSVGESARLLYGDAGARLECGIRSEARARWMVLRTVRQLAARLEAERGTTVTPARRAA
jgi:membrane protein involved in colicin uptake